LWRMWNKTGTRFWLLLAICFTDYRRQSTIYKTI